MFRTGGFAVLVKRVAKYEVIDDGEATVETVPSPETLFPRALLHRLRSACSSAPRAESPPAGMRCVSELCRAHRGARSTTGSAPRESAIHF
jgi:hypothetical protein